MRDGDGTRDGGGGAAERFLARAIALSRRALTDPRGGPFGAVVVRDADGAVVGEGANRVTLDLDPTAHAEVVAIRAACAALGRFDLRGCTLYASCEPCPMCHGAAHWARVDRVVYGASAADAAAAGFDDALLHRELARPPGERALPMRRLLAREAAAVLEAWERRPDRTRY